ncbi:GNAT family N-acetyltransferase [Brachybacterium kimchii]|uniref:GNAT family N-acetyltransferase n=1 Tax=Brachybacterium kimchii TaxID=2942909 RepID=A0ABY4N1M5_9MICO|nr:GNAT family N-acetyltransferase [Brachybacterium kimchii]UQN28438.1 GNAT family N-acetyltransferase [Brachybacterium kimchii]
MSVDERGDRGGPDGPVGPERSTERLDLHVPRLSDLPELHALYEDPRVWQHFPQLRHTEERDTRAMLERWIAQWERDGLGTWIVRPRGEDELLGNAGCSLRGAVDEAAQGARFWNLGYRFRPESQGQGFAREAAQAAIEAARAAAPEVPVVAFLLEHNEASAALARRLGLVQRHRGPDAGNPDPSAIRLVFSDRELSDEELVETLR